MKPFFHLIIAGGLLLGLPFAGAVFFGEDVVKYLEFPPRTQYVEHAPFPRAVFIGLACFIPAIILPFVIRLVRNWRDCPRQSPVRPFPWWGWAGLVAGTAGWLLAWTRFEWFSLFQRHTFTLPWIGYLVVVNAWTYHRTGTCLLTHRTKFFVWLFPLSAAFWWFFEYLNRFVQNWYYIACEDFSRWEYFIAATVSFSTVLPAVWSTEDLLASMPRLTAGLKWFVPARFKQPRFAAAVTLFLSSAGLFLISRFPDILFPLLWVAPLLLLVSLHWLIDHESFFPEMKTGDWRRVFRFCLAALICGFFWEMWNSYSLAKWVYTVPYVNRYHLFEMPVLGFAGYLPFGLECAVIVEWFCKRTESV